MAVATRQVAETCHEQLELLRRQTSAVEAAIAFSVHQTVATEATERQAAATAKPRLIVDRVEGEQIAGGSDPPPRWTVMLPNVGQATATRPLGRSAAKQATTMSFSPAGTVPSGNG
jgi:hypothetical protein